MSETSIMNIQGIDCYELNGVAYLKLEAVARGLGFVVTQSINGKQYENIRWSRVDGYLAELNFTTSGKRPDYIPENIFYRLAMKAKNEVAERFQAKVADEIIPAIRRTGSYSAMPTDYLTALKALVAAEEERVRLTAQNKEMAPKALFADAVTASPTSILVGDLAKLLKQNGVDIGQQRLFNKLREDGYLMKQRGVSWNMPTQRSMEAGWFEIRENTVKTSAGVDKIVKTPLVTGKGQMYFVNKYAPVSNKTVR